MKGTLAKAGEMTRRKRRESLFQGRILALPPQHRTSPRDRTASRPRLAARSTAQVALNLFTRATAFGAAASRGRLAVRWQWKMRPPNSAYVPGLARLLSAVVNKPSAGWKGGYSAPSDTWPLPAGR